MSGSYFGFTPGATQYGSVGTYPPAYGTGTPAAPGTTGYPVAAYNTAYGYTTGPATAAQTTGTNQQNITPNYAYGAPNASAAYYAAPGTGQTGMYQASSAVNASYAAPAAPAAAPGSQATGATGQHQAKQGGATSNENTTYSGYDVALYAAAKSYLASKSTGSSSQWMSMKKGSNLAPGFGGGVGAAATAGASNNRFGVRGGGRGSFPKKGGQYGFGSTSSNYRQNTQLHYCETCKISCGALQTYREHLEGKMHKKKEILAKNGPTNPAKTKNSFYCEVCEIMCTGADTYQSHVKGAKHQKTVKLHQQMGKPVPTQEAKVIPPVAGANGQEYKKIVVMQKTNFVGGEKLTSTGILQSNVPYAADSTENYVDEKDIQPVGEDYLEVIKIEGGRVTAYNCKLCDCRFTDLGAKDMHMKGRRHRLNYKKKVNPDLEVEVKLTPKGRRQMEDKARRDVMRMRQQDIYSMRAMYQSQMNIPNAFGNVMGASPRSGKAALKDTDNDRYIMSKHSAVYPTNDECATAQKLVVATEKALKSVSDYFAEMDKKIKTEDEKILEIGNEERLLKGVMRVGDLAKQLLLKGDMHLDLVVLCSERPTETLLHKVCQLLPERFDNNNEEKYEISLAVADSALMVKSSREPYYELKVTFTSVAVRDGEGYETSKEQEPLDVLDKQKCLEALASLRHAKWFQARCASLQFCLIILRILRDLRQRIPTWIPLSSWATELLIEKVLNCGTVPAQPTEAFRRFFEAVASGILMKCGPGLMDPCEKTSLDALENLTIQQREDITASAQHILRLLAFDQIHTILGVEKIETNGSGQRKRPRDDVEMAYQESNGKKDKKDAV